MISFSYYLYIRREMRDLLRLYPLSWSDFYAKLFMHIRLWFNRYDVIERYLPCEGQIIDLGCGYGFFSNLLALRGPKRQIIGIDQTARKIKYARRGLPNVRFITANVATYTIPPCCGIALIDLLHHLNSFNEQEQLLRKCYGALQRGGSLFIKEIGYSPAYKFFLTRQVDFLLYLGDHFYFRDHDDLSRLLKHIGFTVEFIDLHKGTPYSTYGLHCTKRQ